MCTNERLIFRSVSPNVGANKDMVGNAGKNPIAFTPTSVLKKMTAEKDGE